ncbi:preprotein translocase subunit YajC [Actinocrispum sp. NPDC049592]|uniref:preprotein translocase subunit YajC n=1 Tax=Actinocrispum sp. NPDC049592 TaxID=3154835 RepID=UPI0034355A39
MNLGQLLPFLLIAVLIIPMVLMSRKQKRAMQQQQELQNSISVGDKVMTTSGLYARVAGTDDEATVDLEIAEGVITTWLRAAVREKVSEDVHEEEYVADEDDAVVDEIVAQDADAEAVKEEKAEEKVEANAAAETPKKR